LAFLPKPRRDLAPAFFSATSSFACSSFQGRSKGLTSASTASEGPGVAGTPDGGFRPADDGREGAASIFETLPSAVRKGRKSSGSNCLANCAGRLGTPESAALRCSPSVHAGAVVAAGGLFATAVVTGSRLCVPEPAACDASEEAASGRPLACFGFAASLDLRKKARLSLGWTAASGRSFVEAAWPGAPSGLSGSDDGRAEAGAFRENFGTSR